MLREADAWADWPPILFVRDLQQVLHYRDPSAVRRAMHRGDLGPITRVGRRLAVLRESLIDHLRDQESQTVTPPRPMGSESARAYREALFGDQQGRGRRAS